MTNTSVTQEAFHEAVQAALQDLYNPAALRKNLLLAWLVADKHDPLAAVRKLLTDSIEALKPHARVPPHANAWRVYHILTYRYVEQLTQKEVAAELALSVRQLRRLEHAAVELLSETLWRQHDVKAKVEAFTPASEQKDVPVHAAPDREDELAWIKFSMPSEITELTPVVTSVLQTLAPLADLKEVEVRSALPSDLPPVNGPRATIRQALLNLLSAAVQAVPKSVVEIAGEVMSSDVHLHIRSAGGRGTALFKDEILDKVEMTRRLCALFGGSLFVEPTLEAGAGLSIVLTLPAVHQVSVLVIDDNADALHLLARYVEGSRFVFHGLRDPEQALALAEEVTPVVIVLDVMLPGVDGWELLGRLRTHPDLQSVPVVVCTILPQEQLALALGADAFLRKPIDQETFLATLERLSA